MIFDGKVVQLNELARDFKIDYLLHGRVGKRDGELVVWARLLEVPSGRLLWGAPLEVASSDPAAVLQRLGQAVLFGLDGRDPPESSGTGADFLARPTASLQALDYALQWRSLFDTGGRSENLRARAAAIRAVDLDPGYAAAYAYVAWTFLADAYDGSGSTPPSAQEEALKWARQAVAVDVNEYAAHWALGDVLQSMGRYEDAFQSYEAALAINPNAAELLQDFGTWLLPIMGRPDQGLELALKAMQLNPLHPDTYHGNLALNYYLLERYDDAVEAVRRMEAPRLDHRLYLAASYGQLGAKEAAAEEVEAILSARESLTADSFLSSLPFQRGDDRQHLRSGLLQAGLPS